LVIDARAHRQRTGTGRVDNSTRVYQGAVELQGKSPGAPRIMVGRQQSTVLSSLGFFDGVALDADGVHWRLGLLGGTQPDALSFRPSADIRELGAYAQWHNARGTAGHYQLTLGGVGSYAGGAVNREFLVANTSVVHRAVSLFATQELDVNRAWKRQAESDHVLTWSSTFATMRISLPKGAALSGGYDNRRNVRLYRDFLTPDIEFDDAFRRGWFGGVSVSAPHVYVNVDTRTSDGITAGRSQSTTGSVSLTRITPAGVSLRARATEYHGPTVAGRLTSASIEVAPGQRARLEVSLGTRRDRRAIVGMSAANTNWLGIDADAGIGRSWYFMFSHYREIGGNDRLLQHSAGLSWRY
jgi:hypothetical protein